MSDAGWDRARPPRRWPTLVAVGFALVVVAGLVRPGGSMPVPGGELVIEEPAEPAQRVDRPERAGAAGPQPAVCRLRRGSIAQQLPPRDGWRTVLELPVRGAATSLHEAGDQLIAVDGREDGSFLRLAALDPRGGWACAPPAPIRSRTGAVVAWTGREVLVYGGQGYGFTTDGAAYDPAHRRWRRLPDPPQGTSRVPSAAVWTGEELVVVGTRRAMVRRRSGGYQIRSSVSGAAYHPGTDAWRTTADAPVPLSEAVAVWTGGRLIVLGALLDESDAAVVGLVSLAYDPRLDTWERLADPPAELQPRGLAGALVDKHLVLADAELTVAAYEPSEDRWSTLPAAPLEADGCEPQAVGLPGDTFIVGSCQAAAVLRGAVLGARTWEVVALPPGRTPQRLVRLGGEALLLEGERLLRRSDA